MKRTLVILCTLLSILIGSCGSSRQEQMQQEKREKEQRIKEAEKREREREWREQAENSTCWTTWKEMTRSEKMECINWYLNNIAKIKHQKARNEEIKRWLKADSTQIVRSMKWVMMECGYICHPWE